MKLTDTLTYAASREQFRRQAEASGWQVATVPSSPRPKNTAAIADFPAGGLALDVAWRGPSDGRRTLVVTAGLHGVEGLFGSRLLSDWMTATARQSLLAADADRDHDLRLVAVHCLNPFGYIHRRRTDEQNVDLNRNFLLPGERYDQSCAFDAELDRLLHPMELSRAPDFFRLRLALLAARRGPKRLQQSIAGGQSSNAEGLFYSGSEPAPLVHWCEANWSTIIGSATHITHLDLHSGLGPFGSLKLLLQPGIDQAGIEQMRGRFGAAAVAPPSREVVWTGGKRSDASPNDQPYHARGTWGRWLQHRFMDRRYHYACTEFGTYGPFRMLAALRTENTAWHRCGEGTTEHQRAAARLQASFDPPSTRWRVAVRARFLSLIAAATR